MRLTELSLALSGPVAVVFGNEVSGVNRGGAGVVRWERGDPAVGDEAFIECLDCGGDRVVGIGKGARYIKIYEYS